MFQVTGGQQYYNCTVNGFLPYNTVNDLCTVRRRVVPARYRTAINLIC